MIKSITIENFFSFAGKTKIELNPGVNVLVGINGSGKTNFLRALQLFEEIAYSEGEVNKLVNKHWGGITRIANFSGKKANGVYLKVSMSDSEMLNVYIGAGENGVTNINGIHLTKNAKDTHTFDGIDTSTENVISGTTYHGLGYPARYFGYNYVPYEDHADEVMSGRLVCYSQFDVSINGPIRSCVDDTQYYRLMPDGRNILGVLNFLKNHHSIAFDKVVESMKEIGENIRDISVNSHESSLHLSFRERNLDRAISANHISDGTLRYFLLLLILLNPERGEEICLDEPEIGLHPDMIAGVARLIQKAASEGTQIFVATHSPMLLNAFELEDIIVFEKDAENKTIIKRPSLDDFEADESRLPGFLWLSGRIGGTRW